MIHEYKGFQVKPQTNMPAHYIIVTSGKGGKIPNIMQGLFTSVGIAKNTIDHYLASKTKESPNEAVS